MILLPGADQSQRYDKLGGRETNPVVGVLHTTEGGGWPDYSKGAVAPNLTAWYKPGGASVVRQHFGLDVASRSLKNLSGGVETNNARVLQIELIGTCDPKMKGKLFYWPEADQEALDWLAGLMRTIEGLTGIPRKATSRPWVSYPASAGNSSARMSFAEWQSFSGWCGHQHVPENDHGDPGNINIAYLMGTSAAPVQGGATAPVYPKLGASGDDVTNIQAQLVNLGYVLPSGVDGSFGPETDSAIRALQGAAGITVDGIVGPDTRAALDRGVRPGVGTPAPVSVVLPVGYELLDVDGALGPKTIARWQQVMGTPVDGVISKPSALIKVVQARIGCAPDGVMGPQTISALQRHFGTPADGVISKPSSVMVAALQRALNANQF